MVGIFFLELEISCYMAQPLLVPSDKKLDFLPCKLIGANENCIIDVNNISIDNSNSINNNIWNLCYDGSKTQDGVVVSCISLDLAKNKTLISCPLEFECTNNTTKYEAKIFGLKKSMICR